jgi:hypothetical protein
MTLHQFGICRVARSFVKSGIATLVSVILPESVFVGLQVVKVVRVRTFAMADMAYAPAHIARHIVRHIVRSSGFLSG